jgi:phenylacetate-CoA ligase
VQSASQAGKILVTDLLNYGMPFIRYAIGDIGTLSARQCPCGRGLPILEEVGGRLVDMVYAPDGRPVASITLIPNLFHMVGITNRAQIVQDALDHIIIKIEKPAPSKEILERQKQIIGQIFGPAMRVTHEFVDNIPKLKSGKYAYIVCKIPADKLGRP